MAEFKGGTVIQLVVDIGMVCCKTFQYGLDDGDGCGCHPKIQRLPLAGPNRVPCRIIRHFKDAGNPRIKSMTRLGQPDVAGASFKELNAELVFQHLHLIADRRLCDMKPPRRFTDAAGVCNRLKIFHLFQIHVRDLTCKIL